MSGSQPTPTRFGELLRQWRRAAGLTQEELAARAGMSFRGVSDLERGVNRSARRETVQMLADALQLGAHDRTAFQVAARASAAAPAPLPARHAAFRALAAVPRLVGRRQEVARIEGHLAAANDGEGLLLFAGEPGMGKSHLLYETAERAGVAGWRVLVGGCTRRSGQEPYAPFVDMLLRSLAPLSMAEKRRRLQGCAWLVRLLPELLEMAVVPAPSWSLPPEQEQRLMFAAVARYLANGAGPSGTLLVLDDLQWAGADGLDLLDRLVRTAADAAPPAGTPESGAGPQLRLVGAYRSTEVDLQHPLGVLQADLVRAGLAARYTLGRLSATEASTLAQDLLVDVGADQAEQAMLVERLTSRAGGVPFYLVNAAQAVRVGALEDGTAQALTKDRRGSGCARAEEMPWAVAETIRQRVAVLPERARDLLGVAAVIGRVVPCALLEAAMAAVETLVQQEFVSALDAACRGQLLEELEERQGRAGGAVRYQFAHDLIHEVILHDVGAARRIRLHRAVAEVIERLPEAERTRRASELADHLTLAGESMRALPYALLAGDQAEAVYALEEANRLFTVAAALAEAHADQRREAEALERLAKVRFKLLRPAEACECGEQALRLFETLGDIEGQAEVMYWLALAQYECGMQEEAIARLQALLAHWSARGLSAPRQGRLHLRLAGLLSNMGIHAEGPAAFAHLHAALQAAERAAALARAVGDTALLAEAVHLGGRTHGWLGHSDAELEAYHTAIPFAESSHDLSFVCALCNDIACVHEFRGEFAVGQVHVAAAVAAAEHAGVVPRMQMALGTRAELSYYAGDWETARADWERAAAISRTGAEHLSAEYLSSIAVGLLSLVQGRENEPSALLRQLAGQAERRHDLQGLRFAHSILAECDLLQTRPNAARARLEPLLDRSGLEEPEALFVLAQLAWALLELGQEAPAEAMAVQSCERARTCHYHLWLVDGLRVLAMVRLRQARWEDAYALLEEALVMCRAMPYPYAEAKALYVYGQLHAAKGEPELAREKYQAALAICERLGEGLYRPHIKQALVEVKRD
jgi:transcriptional regulator with XRE-family HTH domain/tetratricopeptide (TPR) repeat protein